MSRESSAVTLEIGLNAAIVAVTDEVPRVLTVRRATGSGEFADALPFGPLDPAGDRTLELGLRAWVREQSGLELGYVEQLYTFGDRDRDPGETTSGARVLSVAYLALVRQSEPSGAAAEWRDWYTFLPWEDWREGRPPVIDEIIGPSLDAWALEAQSSSDRRDRHERREICFGLSHSPWDTERVLQRYELLYEVGLVSESSRDRVRKPGGRAANPTPLPGQELALDHRRILATALSRLRGKIKYRPVVFELVPPTFTLFQLQRVVEALAGVRLHKQNFRRLVEKGGLVERTGKVESKTGGRPAELFQFRRGVLRERPTPGVGLPGFHT